jgi:hypothetical protein
MAAASLSGLTPMHPQWDLPLPGFAKVPAPYWFGAQAAGYGDIGPEEFGLLIAQARRKILELGARIASRRFRPNRCRARAGSSFRPPPIGRKCSASAANTMCCCIWTK